MKKSSQESSREFISIGLMLFALFFGAGNLIFPVFLGQNAGWNTPWATIGFLITGVGLPFAAVLAICYSGAGLKELASRVHPVYGVLFSSLLYLTIGPFFAIPRTATVSFEIAAAPFLTDAQKTIGLYVFVFIFFLLSWWLAVTPSKLVPRIGKVITPMLLLFLFILIGSSILFPMGPWMEPSAAYSAPLKAFTNALVEGYNTMDCLAGLVFGVIVVESIRFFGVKTNEEVARSAMKSGLISTFFMFIIYASLVVLGADSVSVLGHMETGAPVLSGASAYYFGTSGAVLLGLIVILACLTTSIGLIASCAAYFHQLFPMLHRQTWAALFAGFSFLIALFGLSAIIKGAIPVLLFLYPLAVSLIILTFLDKRFDGSQKVYALATACTFVPALYDGLKMLKLTTPAMDQFMHSLPLAEYDMAWTLFFITGFVLGFIWHKAADKAPATAESN